MLYSFRSLFFSIIILCLFLNSFLSSQKFIEKQDDDSIIFTVDYTQNLEILPFIQSWMPNITIVEPQELKEAYLKKLQEAVNNI